MTTKACSECIESELTILSDAESRSLEGCVQPMSEAIYLFVLSAYTQAVYNLYKLKLKVLTGLQSRATKSQRTITVSQENIECWNFQASVYRGR